MDGIVYRVTLNVTVCASAGEMLNYTSGVQNTKFILLSSGSFWLTRTRSLFVNLLLKMFILILLHCDLLWIQFALMSTCNQVQTLLYTFKNCNNWTKTNQNLFPTAMERHNNIKLTHTSSEIHTQKNSADTKKLLKK